MGLWSQVKPNWIKIQFEAQLGCWQNSFSCCYIFLCPIFPPLPPGYRLPSGPRGHLQVLDITCSFLLHGLFQYACLLHQVRRITSHSSLLRFCKDFAKTLLCQMKKSKGKSLSRVQLFVTPWTIQSMEFSRPEYQSG